MPLKTAAVPHTATPLLRSGGLLSTQWDQDYPYNQLCPRDPMNDYSYSYAGCPAVAMAQIINYLQTTQDTRFSDSDDYAHHYLGRNFNIDDDWETLQFPSFPQLNELLDSVDAAFQRGEELSDELVAALIFACGTACTQVYSSQGSGTFAVDQAYDAYQRFGVVDGYRETDGKFHINFGYGGSLDNWYDIPDPNFYYGLTKLEGIIVDIIPTTSAVQEFTRQQPMEVYPNPVSDILYVKNLPCGQVNFAIYNALGQEIVTGSTYGTISVSDLENGFYFLILKGKDFQKTSKFIVK